eukprot:1296937-Pleurochrysis_carterae.AAC.3
MRSQGRHASSTPTRVWRCSVPPNSIFDEGVADLGAALALNHSLTHLVLHRNRWPPVRPATRFSHALSHFTERSRTLPYAAARCCTLLHAAARHCALLLATAPPDLSTYPRTLPQQVPPASSGHPRTHARLQVLSAPSALCSLQLWRLRRREDRGGAQAQPRAQVPRHWRLQAVLCGSQTYCRYGARLARVTSDADVAAVAYAVC